MSYLGQRILDMDNEYGFGFCVALDDFHAIHIPSGSRGMAFGNSPEFLLHIISNGQSAFDYASGIFPIKGYSFQDFYFVVLFPIDLGIHLTVRVFFGIHAVIEFQIPYSV